MFPGAHDQVYYNEAGEPLGWDRVDDDPRDAQYEAQREYDEVWQFMWEDAEDQIWQETDTTDEALVQARFEELKREYLDRREG